MWPSNYFLPSYFTASYWTKGADYYGHLGQDFSAIPETAQFTVPLDRAAFTVPQENPMSSSSYVPQIGEIVIGETQGYLVDFGDTVDKTGPLDTGETLTGTPTITQESVDPDEIDDLATASMTLDNKAVGTSTPIINGRQCSSGEYIRFTGAIADGANAVGAVYTVKITCGTTSSPARTLVRRVRIRVIP